MGGGLGNPVAVAVGDFVNTGDGLLDLAVTWDREDALGIFENNGDGTFTLAHRRDAPPDPSMGGPPAAESNIGLNPAAVVAIDLDGDGVRDDVAGVNQDSNRFFAYENGGGTWVPADPEAERGGGLSATVGQWGSSVFPADACDDFFSATPNGAVNIAVSKCDGSGEFEIVSKFFRAGEVSVQTDVEVGDFVTLGGDAGQVDVLTLDNLLQQLVIWPGDPSLDVNLLVATPVPDDMTLLVFKPVMVAGEPASPVQSVAQDWDGDGALDLLVMVEEGYVLWYRGNGDPALGGFDDPLVVDLAGPLSTGERQPTRLTSMEYADVVGADGASAPDGIADLVIADAGQATGSEEGFNWLWIVPGTGPAPATFGPPTFDTSVQYHYAAANLGVLKPSSLAVADFNGTGDAPGAVLLAFDRSVFTVFGNDGAGRFNAAPSYAAGATGARGLAGRELAGNPADLVVACRGLEGISSLPGDGTGRLIEPGALAEPTAESLADELKLHDFDADTVPDALVTFRNEHALYRGVADGSYLPPEILSDGPGRSLSGISRVGRLGAGSSDALDLAIFDPALGNTTLGIWLGNGDGSFSLDQEVDGILRYSTHAVGRFIGGTGLDSIVVAGETDSFPSPPQLSVVTADGGGTYSVTATLAFPPPFDAFPIPVEFLIPGDFDLNGSTDLVAVLGGGDSFLFKSDGSRLEAQGTFFSVGSLPRDGIAVDLDGDFFPDLAVANRDTVEVLANNSGAFSARLTLDSNIDNATIVAQDLNGDGLPELVASSERTNDLTVFRNVSVAPFRITGGPDPTGTLCRFSWPAVDGAVYSVLRGNLTTLWEDRTRPLLDATEVPCAGSGIGTAFYDDALPLPAPEGSWPPLAFYLVRCQGANCGDGSFGSDSLGAVRYANDPPDPCP
jgi:hypothetical protein